MYRMNLTCLYTIYSYILPFTLYTLFLILCLSLYLFLPFSVFLAPLSLPLSPHIAFLAN